MEWTHAITLHRSDVERWFGKPTLSTNFVRYETEADLIDVLYLAGPCAMNGVEKWNVPSDVVIWMQVSPKSTVLFASLNLDGKKYSRFREAHPDNWIQYWNETDGIIVHTILYGTTEELFFSEYRPTANQENVRDVSAR